MSLSIRITRDDITPDLRGKIGAVARPEGVWRAVGTQVVSLTKRAFREPTLRIAPWSQKRDGAASNLIAKGMLTSSIRIVGTTKTGVTVGSDRKYAAIHQLGGVIRPKNKAALVFWSGGRMWRVKQVKIPARPFFPFNPDGSVAQKHERKIMRMVDQAMQKQLGMKG